MRAKLFALIACLAFMPHAAEAYTYKVLHDFCSLRACSDGAVPGPLTWDMAGNLYGIARNRPQGGPGPLYKLVPNATHDKWRFISVYEFPDSVFSPIATLIFDTSGNIYGLLSDAGFPRGSGQLYELALDGVHHKRTFKELEQFDHIPQSGLTYQGAAAGAPYDGVSPLYGSFVDRSDVGGVYQLATDGTNWTFGIIHSFCDHCADGVESGDLTDDGTGGLIGAAFGSLTKNVVFKLTKSGDEWDETLLPIYCKCYPAGPVTRDASGDLYVLAGKGRAHDCCGALYKIATDGTRSRPYKFCALRNCRDGADPVGRLLLDAAGTLFGATTDGGGHNGDRQNLGGGTIFAWDGTALQTLYRFCAKSFCRDGAYPVGGLIMDADGNLFGTTQQGGLYDKGVVFELSP